MIGALPLHEVTPGGVRRVARAYLAAIGAQLPSLAAAADAAGDRELAAIIEAHAVAVRTARAKVEGEL
ncbi:MAG: hypothetical protein JWM74_5702 [Myxococcaceae bacterium]|nr:hypothetical protein [Myxococcaceae bacterium]